MRKFNTRLFAGLLAVFCCMTALSATAYADGGYYEQSEDGSETPPSSIDSITISAETVRLPEQQGSEALTPDGNLTLIDEDSAPVCSCKDKCEAGAVNTACAVCKTNMTECMGKEKATEKTPEPDPTPDTSDSPDKDGGEKKSGSGLVVIVLLLLMAGGGALYWFKLRKKKPDTKGPVDLDDYDYGDEDEEYENEDDADEPEETEDADA